MLNLPLHLDALLFGVRYVYGPGDVATERPGLTFSAPFVVTDGPTTTTVALPTASSSGAGLLPATSGAHKVCVSSAGNAPTWAKIVNDNVDDAAAIHGDKLASVYTSAREIKTTAGALTLDGFATVVIQDNNVTIATIGSSGLTLAAGKSLISAAAAVWGTVDGSLTLNGDDGLIFQSSGVVVASIPDGEAGLELAAGKNLSGAAGAGGLSLGSMTGATALPTGNLSWAGAAGKTLTFVGADAFTITGGASSSLTSTVGTLLINAPIVVIQESGSTVLSFDGGIATLGGGKTLDAKAGLVDVPDGADFKIDGTALPATWTAANVGTASLPTKVRQAANTTLTTVTLAATDLVLTLSLGEWTVFVAADYTLGATSDGYRHDFDAGGGLVVSNVRRRVRSYDITNGTLNNLGTYTDITTDHNPGSGGGGGASVTSFIEMDLTVTTAGTLTFRTAKSTDVVNDTVFLASSRIHAIRKAT